MSADRDPGEELLSEVELRRRRGERFDRLHVTPDFFDEAVAQLRPRVEGDKFYIHTPWGRVAVLRTP